MQNINIPAPEDTADLFAKITLTTDLEGMLIKVALIMSSLFLLIWIIEQVNNIVLREEPIRKTMVLKAAGLIGLLIFYAPLLHDIVDPFLESITTGVTEVIPDPGEKRYLLKELSAKGTSSSGLNISIKESVKQAMISMTVSWIGVIDDALSYFFKIYVQINLFLVRAFGPLALVFSLFPGFSLAFLTWLKLYFKYNFYALVVNVGILLSRTFLYLYFDGADATDAISGGAATLTPATGIWILISVAIAYLVFKILFIVMGFRMLDDLFVGRSVGVGGMVGGIASTGVQIVSTKFTKNTTLLRKAESSATNVIPK